MKILLRKCSSIRCRDFTFFNGFQVVGNCRSRKWRYLSRYETDDRNMKNCENQVILGSCMYLKICVQLLHSLDFERRAKIIRSWTTMVSQKLRFFCSFSWTKSLAELKMAPRLFVLLLRFPIFLSCRACVRNKCFFT